MRTADFCEEVEDEHGNKTPPPSELVLGFQVDKWGSGAVFGAPVPARLLNRMSTLLNVHQAFRSYRAGAHRLAAWAQAHPDHCDIVTKILQMRKEQNA